jgi:hypothetical protein
VFIITSEKVRTYLVLDWDLRRPLKLKHHRLEVRYVNPAISTGGGYSHNGSDWKVRLMQPLPFWCTNDGTPASIDSAHLHLAVGEVDAHLGRNPERRLLWRPWGSEYTVCCSSVLDIVTVGSTTTGQYYVNEICNILHADHM